MSKFGDNLKYLRKRSEWSQEELARRTGLTRSAISMYELGQREPDFETTELFADIFNVDLDFLTGRIGMEQRQVFPSNIEPMPGMRKIPLLGTIACGEPILAAENIEDEVDIPENIRADFALRCKGDSMINARIFDGDIVYIRQQREVNNGQIAAVLIGNEATLKRVYYYPGRLELRPENPTFPVLQYEGTDLEDVQIIGLAVAFTSNVR